MLLPDDGHGRGLPPWGVSVCGRAWCDGERSLSARPLKDKTIRSIDPWSMGAIFHPCICVCMCTCAGRTYVPGMISPSSPSNSSGSRTYRCSAGVSSPCACPHTTYHIMTPAASACCIPAMHAQANRSIHRMPTPYIHTYLARADAQLLQNLGVLLEGPLQRQHPDAAAAGGRRRRRS